MPSDQVTLAQLQKMALSWGKWLPIFATQTASQRVDVLGPAVDRGYRAALASLETWQFALTAAGYVATRAPSLGGVRGDESGVRQMARTIAQQGWQGPYPEFKVVAGMVATIDVEQLVGAAPLLTNSLAVDAEFDFVAGSRLQYCIDRYSPDTDAVIRCVHGGS